jgi:L-serine dehydratase
VNPDTVESRLTNIRNQGYLRLLETYPVSFDCEKNLVFRRDDLLPGHSNGMRFTAYKCQDEELASKIFYSVGGGFIIAEGEQLSERDRVATAVPYPFQSAADLLRLGKKYQRPIWRR